MGTEDDKCWMRQKKHCETEKRTQKKKTTDPFADRTPDASASRREPKPVAGSLTIVKTRGERNTSREEKKTRRKNAENRFLRIFVFTRM